MPGRTVSGYSGRAVKPIALRHILEMTKEHIFGNTHFSGIGGIETWRDASRNRNNASK